jgi:hypothetical protein
MRTGDLLSLYGRGGDSVVAHISPKEAVLLKTLGGSGTVNPQTGLLEFFDLSGGEGGSIIGETWGGGNPSGYGMGSGFGDWPGYGRDEEELAREMDSGHSGSEGAAAAGQDAGKKAAEALENGNQPSAINRIISKAADIGEGIIGGKIGTAGAAILATLLGVSNPLVAAGMLLGGAWAGKKGVDAAADWASEFDPSSPEAEKAFAKGPDMQAEGVPESDMSTSLDATFTSPVAQADRAATRMRIGSYGYGSTPRVPARNTRQRDLLNVDYLTGTYGSK